ncbi:MAG: type II toxin-antitoxin system death-on-curing family toxin [Cyanobacteria bacterium J06639_1]
MTPVWLSLDIVLAVHTESIRQYGGLDGLRDEGLLLSALGKPQNIYQYESQDIFDLAAAYGFGIAKNHAFIDGNKRTALASMAVFLGLNRYIFCAPEPRTIGFVINFSSGRQTKTSVSEWLRKHSLQEVCEDN